MGGKAGSWLDSVTGLGAYNVRSNSLLNSRTIVANPNGPPRVVNSKRGEATVINHREYVGDLSSGTFVLDTTSTEFTVSRYQLNPGNSSLFPWLSSASLAYQEYEINGMLVELVTEASEVSTNLALGVMAMAAEYNPLAETPSTKQQMLELEYADVCKTSHSLIMPIECARINDAETHLFIAEDNDYLGTDARTFDLAAIFIASSGQPAENTKIAEIWVTYEVLLFKPKLPLFSNLRGGRALIIAGADEEPFGPLSEFDPDSMPGFRFEGQNELYLPPHSGARWLILIYFDVALLATMAQPTYDFVDCEVTIAWNTAAGNADHVGISDIIAVNPAQSMAAIVVKVTGPGPRIQFNYSDLLENSVGTLYALPVPRSLDSSVASSSRLVSRKKAKAASSRAKEAPLLAKEESCHCVKCSKSG